MFKLHINPSAYRKWRLVFEPATGGSLPPVDIYAFTFQDAIHDWWQNSLENQDFPHDVVVELVSTIGGVITIYIENDQLCIWDVTEEDDPNLVSCADLLEYRKQQRLAKKGKK